MLINATWGLLGVLCGPITAFTARRTRLPSVRGGIALSGTLAVTAVAIAAVAVLGHRFGGSLSLCAWAWFVLLGIALIVVDLQNHRPPLRLVLPLWGGGVFLLGAASLAEDRWGPIIRAASASAAVLSVASVIAVVLSPSVRGGDALLYCAVAWYLAWAGWRQLAFGLTLSMTLTAVAAVLLTAGHRIAGHRIDVGEQIAHAPAAIGGAFLALVLFCRPSAVE